MLDTRTANPCRFVSTNEPRYYGWFRRLPRERASTMILSRASPSAKVGFEEWAVCPPPHVLWASRRDETRHRLTNPNSVSSWKTRLPWKSLAGEEGPVEVDELQPTNLVLERLRHEDNIGLTASRAPPSWQASRAATFGAPRESSNRRVRAHKDPPPMHRYFRHNQAPTSLQLPSECLCELRARVRVRLEPDRGRAAQASACAERSLPRPPNRCHPLCAYYDSWRLNVVL